MEQELTDEELEAPFEDAETEAMISAAIANARQFYDYEVADEVRYVAGDDTLQIMMKSGQRVAIPVEYLQDLADADRNLVAAFEIVGFGSALHWEELDVDFGTEGLVKGLYGNERWMKRLEEKRRSDTHASLSRIA